MQFFLGGAGGQKLVNVEEGEVGKLAGELAPEVPHLPAGRPLRPVQPQGQTQNERANAHLLHQCCDAVERFHLLEDDAFHRVCQDAAGIRRRNADACLSVVNAECGMHGEGRGKVSVGKGRAGTTGRRRWLGDAGAGALAGKRSVSEGGLGDVGGGA